MLPISVMVRMSGLARLRRVVDSEPASAHIAAEIPNTTVFVHGSWHAHHRGRRLVVADRDQRAADPALDDAAGDEVADHQQQRPPASR